VLYGGARATARRRRPRPARPLRRAPLTELLLLVYRRRPAHGDDLQVFGDEKLLDFWLERVSFG
jgi:hypothetical protein